MSHATNIQHLFSKGMAFNGLGLVFRFSRVFYLILFSRLLGAETFGLYLLSFLVIETLSKVAMLGFNGGALRLGGYYAKKNSPDAMIRSGHAIAWMSFFISLSFAAGLWFLGPWVAAVVFKKPQLGALFSVMGICMPFWSLSYIYMYALRSRLTTKYEFYVHSALEPMIVLGLGIWFIHIGWGAYGLVLAHVISCVTIGLLSIIFFIKEFPWRNRLPTWDMPWRYFWKESLDFCGISTLSTLKDHMDTMLIGRMLPLSMVGMYGAASNVSAVTKKIKALFDPIVLPIAQNMHALQDHQQHRMFVRHVFDLIIFVALLVIGVLMVAPEWILSFFGSEYVQASFVLQILLLGQWMFLLSSMLEAMLIFTGYSRWVLLNTLIMVVVSFVGIVWLVPKYQMLGSAVAMSMATLLVACIAYGIFYKKMNFHPISRRSFGLFVVAASLMLGCVWLKSMASWPVFVWPFVFLLVFGGLGFYLYRRHGFFKWALHEVL